MDENRKKARWRLRRIIYNNDGDDVIEARPDDVEHDVAESLLVRQTGDTVQDFLDTRSTPLIGSQVDSNWFASAMAGLTFSHHTTLGGFYGKEIPLELVEKYGRDTLQIQLDFSREHGMEAAWCLRMNDCHDAHPMAMVSGVVACMSAFYHDTTDIQDSAHRDVFAHRIIAKIPTIAAAAYKHSLGQPFAYPQNRLDYCSNLLSMLFSVPTVSYEVDPVAAEALDLLFILHADHEQNCSTSTVRLAGSSGTNPYSAISAGISALWGPAHGGANEAVINMLEEIGEAKNINKYVAKAKDKEDAFRLMGFGHRVYKNHDPRATIIRQMCHRVLEKLGQKQDTPLFELALELEQIALKDSYFVEKNLYPNVDFYSGIIYQALGIPKSMFTVMFAIARTVGWVAQWREMVRDSETRIGRPRQLYIGPAKRDYLPISDR